MLTRCSCESLPTASAASRLASPERRREQVKDQATRIAEYAARIVAEAPPITPEQRDRIIVLLRGA